MDDFQNARRKTEAEYQKALLKILHLIKKKCLTHKKDDDKIKALRDIVNSADFNEYAESAVTKMVSLAISTNEKSWKAAAAKSSKGRKIYEALLNEHNQQHIQAIYQPIMENNMALIKTVSIEVANRMIDIMSQEHVEGSRAAVIAEHMSRYGADLTNYMLVRIARTESSKVSTAVTQIRSQNMGINWYIWRTSDDARVRKAHQHMDDVLINWQDPPDPEALVGEKSYGSYHAGCIFNCRCYPEPIIDLNDLKWPHKAAIGNSIVQTKLKDLK